MRYKKLISLIIYFYTNIYSLCIQVAQQEAQRAQFIVEKAKQECQQAIVQAEGEAQAAQLIGEAISRNTSYLKLRKIRAAQNISKTVRRKYFCLIIFFTFHVFVR